MDNISSTILAVDTISTTTPDEYAFMMDIIPLELQLPIVVVVSECYDCDDDDDSMIQ